MPLARADLAVHCRWILPMTSPATLLRNHTVIVRDGRILDLLPSAAAAECYTATVAVTRDEHLVMPGLVNAYTQIVPAAGRDLPPAQVRDAAQLCLAEMLRAGTTCFCSVGPFPEESARHAIEQGMRAVIGIPIEETARALNFRDEYRGHPTLATLFAPQAPCSLPDETFRRIATLADELDAGVLVRLHTSPAEIEESVARFGARPLERLQALGLLTPSFTAVQMVQVTRDDMTLAQRGGIAVILCPKSCFLTGGGPPPVAAWSASGLRLGTGTGLGSAPTGFNPWTDIQLWALLSADLPHAMGAAGRAWDALAAATRGAAATLGLDSEIGTLETGKWGDMCCVDLRSPALQGSAAGAPLDIVTQLPFSGGPEVVSDVWVAGRHLVNGGAFTRLDWQALTARVTTWHPSF